MSHPFTMPEIPTELAEIIAVHRDLFGGFKMVDEGGQADKADAADAADSGKSDDKAAADKAAQAEGFKSDDSKKSVLADLAKEREARKKLESELTPMKATIDALKGALGGAEVKPEDAVKALTEQMGELKHQILVERVARENKITEADDLDLLREATSEEAMVKLAKRLAPAEGDSKDGKGGKPKADPSAGKGGGDGAKPTGVSAGRDLFRETHPSKTT